LAVVVQRMVEADVAGVLFTAHPITGTRGRAALNAVRRLGEQLVSGAVNPDYFLADTRPGNVRERRAEVLAHAPLLQPAAFGTAPPDPTAGVPITVEAGMRLFLDMTPVLRNPALRELPGRAMSVMEARSARVLARVLEDPRLAPRQNASRVRSTVAALRV